MFKSENKMMTNSDNKSIIEEKRKKEKEKEKQKEKGNNKTTSGVKRSESTN